MTPLAPGEEYSEYTDRYIGWQLLINELRGCLVAAGAVNVANRTEYEDNWRGVAKAVNDLRAAISALSLSGGSGGGGGSAAWGSIGGSLSNQTDLQSALDAKANSVHSQGWATITGTPANLAGYGITDAQPLDSDLSAIAALSTTAFGRSLLVQADAPTALSTLGGQPLDSDLEAIAALSTTAFGRSLLTQANAAAVCSLLQVPRILVRARRITDLALTNAAFNDLVWTIEDFDESSYWDGTTFIVPESGIYTFDYVARFASTAGTVTAVEANPHISVNGTNINIGGRFQFAGALNPTINASHKGISLIQSDQIKTRVFVGFTGSSGVKFDSSTPAALIISKL